METSIVLSWIINNNQLSRELDLPEGKVLLSQYYLQNLLPPTCKFVSLSAVVQFGEVKTKMEIPSHKDIEGNIHFLIESSLSKEFFIDHTETTFFVSDSNEQKLNDFSFESTQKYGDICIQISDKSDSSSSKEVLLGEEGSSSDIQILAGSSTGKYSNDDSPYLQSGLQTPTSHQSIIPYLLNCGRGKRLQNLLLMSSNSSNVLEVPTTYNGLCVFELPPTFGKVSNMEGMQQKYDGHVWSRPRKSNLSVPANVNLSYCLGHFECRNYSCIYYKSNKKCNDRFFVGYLENQVSKGLPAEEERSKIACQYCKQIVYCLETCSCSVYYVIPPDSSMTRLFIHQGEHSHPVEPGTSRAAIERLKKLVSTCLKFNKDSGPRKLQMLIARKLLMESLTTENSGECSERNLNSFLEELIPLIENQR